MKNEILKILNEGNGLNLLEVPTGAGKTYNSVQAMVDYVLHGGKKNIVFLTTLNKNLPVEELKKAFGNDELYDKYVLRIRSNFNEVVEKLEALDIPEKTRPLNYHQLLRAVKIYNEKKGKISSDKDYIENIEERISEEERNFHKEIEQKLKSGEFRFKSKKEKLDVLKHNPDYQWIGKLYPAVFTSEYQIKLMSISKFMKRNTVLIESSYRFISDYFLKDSIVIIDEFDATKETIQSEIIEKVVNVKENCIKLYRHLNWKLNKLNIERLSAQTKDALMDLNTSNINLKSVKEEAEEINKNYSMDINLKTVEESETSHEIFLFNDGSLHTVLDNNKNCIRCVYDKKENINKIYLESKEEYKKNKKDSDIVIYSMIRSMYSYFRNVMLLISSWAKEYVKIENEKRKEQGHKNLMTEENALDTILNDLALSSSQKEFLKGEQFQLPKSKTKNRILDLCFYEFGMEYYSLEDHDSHNNYTDLNLVRITDTPEKILVYLSEIATVIGMSATAEMPTVIGNYDLEYLKSKLKDKFHLTNKFLKDNIRNNLKVKWESYRNGEITLNGKIIKETLEYKEYLCGFMQPENAEYALNTIRLDVDDQYYICRYCNLLEAFCEFIKHKDIQSMLYLGMALPKINNPKFDKNLINDLFQIALENYDISKGDIELFILNGDNFDERKIELEDKLSKDKKIFVMSSYQTLGAGQNLQYEIPFGKDLVYLGNNDENDNRYKYKDFDAIYLGNITHKTVNIRLDEILSKEDLVKFLIQIEEVYENGEISYRQKDALLKKAFKAASGGKFNPHNELNKTRSVIIQSTSKALQAVGRLCRTNVKNPNIYLMIDEKLLSELQVEEYRKRIVPPEIQKLVELKNELPITYSAEDHRILFTAEKISSQTKWVIKKTLSQNWTEEKMEFWQWLRNLVLRHPTLNQEEYESDKEFTKLYITSGTKQNRYLFSQYSDFTDVVIDFGTDKIAFRNSDRALKASDTNEIVVYEMSEEASGLPAVLKYHGMEDYFEENGYATSFNLNDYMMTPILFHNIYKGALGEVAGEFILKSELGIKLKQIEDPTKFEFFDFELSEGIYIDSKNWKYSYIQDRNQIRKKIIAKLDAIGGKRVYIINIVADKGYKPSMTTDERIVEIPALIDEDGKIIIENLKMIKKEDFEYEE